jgi:hypothetical protein
MSTARRKPPLQFGLVDLFDLTTRAAVVVFLLNIFGGVLWGLAAIMPTALAFFVEIIPEVLWALICLSALTGALLSPYALWLVLQRLMGRDR